MLNVIKKNLKVEPFVLEKIKTSIANSSDDDPNFSINQSELNLIAGDVERKIIDMRGIDGKTSSYEIRCLVLKSLHDLTYHKLANSYYNYCNK